MRRVIESENEIVFVEGVPAAVRVFLAVIGLLPMTLAPYELLIRPGWQTFSLAWLLAALMALVAGLIGAVFIAAGIFGLDRELAVNASTQALTYSYRSPVVPLGHRRYKFSEVTDCALVTHNWSDGPSTHALSFTLADGQKINIGGFERLDEAQRCHARVKQLLPQG